MFLFVLQKLKSIALLFLNIIRRAFCCFRRRRRQSNSEQLSHIIINENAQNELEQWNDWEFKNRKPVSVEEHIEYYRQQQTKLRQHEAAEEEAELVNEDLFQDMMPRITKQKRIVINDCTSNESTHSLDMKASETFLTNQLENWDENSGWEKSEALDTVELLREKKREERERRFLEQQQKRAEKSNRSILGAKLVT